eukprot:gene40481-58118_t
MAPTAAPAHRCTRACSALPPLTAPPTADPSAADPSSSPIVSPPTAVAPSVTPLTGPTAEIALRLALDQHQLDFPQFARA